MEDTTIARTITQHENDSSIEITRNTKGFTWSVKAYGKDDDDIRGKLVELLDTVKQLVKQEEEKSSS